MLTAAMTVQSVTVHLQPPERRTDPPQTALDSVAMNAVSDLGKSNRHLERKPLSGCCRTNLPVDTFAPGWDGGGRIPRLYRWQVEIFFKVLKSGCRVEKLQLETEDRLETVSDVVEGS